MLMAEAKQLREPAVKSENHSPYTSICCAPLIYNPLIHPNAFICTLASLVPKGLDGWVDPSITKFEVAIRLLFMVMVVWSKGKLKAMVSVVVVPFWAAAAKAS